MAIAPCCEWDTDGDGNCPRHPVKPIQRLEELDPVWCECGHDLGQHEAGFWAPCTVPGCNCNDFTIDEQEEINEDEQ